MFIIFNYQFFKVFIWSDGVYGVVIKREESYSGEKGWEGGEVNFEFYLKFFWDI